MPKENRIFFFNLIAICLSAIILLFLGIDQIDQNEEEEAFNRSGRASHSANALLKSIESTLLNLIETEKKLINNSLTWGKISSKYPAAFLVKDESIFLPGSKNNLLFTKYDLALTTNDHLFKKTLEYINQNNLSLAQKAIISVFQKAKVAQDQIILLYTWIFINKKLNLDTKSLEDQLMQLLANLTVTDNLPWPFLEILFRSHLEKPDLDQATLNKIRQNAFDIGKNFMFDHDMNSFWPLLLKNLDDRKLELEIKKIIDSSNLFVKASQLLLHRLKPLLFLGSTRKNEIYLSQENDLILIGFAFKQSTETWVIQLPIQQSIKVYDLLKNQNTSDDFSFTLNKTDKKQLKDIGIFTSTIVSGLNLTVQEKNKNDWRKDFNKQKMMTFLVFIFVFFIIITTSIIQYFSVLKRMELAKLRNDFVSNVSHELKTPVTSIHLMTETLALDRLPESKKKEYYNTMLKESSRLQKLITNILNFSKLEKGARKNQMERVSLREALKDATATLNASFNNKDIYFEIDLPNEDLFLYTDRDALDQILFNLIDNAIKYSSKHSHSKILISAIDRPSNIQIIIEDNGNGIDKKDMPYIFNKFYRGSIMTQAVSGSGLGLSIVKHLVESLNGKIDIHSDLNKGTKVVITFNKKT